MSESYFIACDLGAGSGRVILGKLSDGRLTLDEIHRFTSPPVKRHGTFALGHRADFRGTENRPRHRSRRPEKKR